MDQEEITIWCKALKDTKKLWSQKEIKYSEKEETFVDATNKTLKGRCPLCSASLKLYENGMEPCCQLCLVCRVLLDQSCQLILKQAEETKSLDIIHKLFSKMDIYLDTEKLSLKRRRSN